MEMRRSISEISEEAANILKNHSWPGNVRELRTVIRRAVPQAPGTRLERDTIARAIGTSQESTMDPVAGSAKRSLKEIAGSAAEGAGTLAIIEALNRPTATKRRLRGFSGSTARFSTPSASGIRARSDPGGSGRKIERGGRHLVGKNGVEGFTCFLP